jgi:hypothetical protein
MNLGFAQAGAEARRFLYSFLFLLSSFFFLPFHPDSWLLNTAIPYWLPSANYDMI